MHQPQPSKSLSEAQPQPSINEVEDSLNIYFRRGGEQNDFITLDDLVDGPLGQKYNKVDVLACVRELHKQDSEGLTPDISFDEESEMILPA